MRRTLTATGSLALVGALALTGCSSGSKKASATGPSGGAAPTPAAVLATAKKTLDDTSGVHFVLTSDKIPASENGLISGEGDGSHAPAFKGTIGIRIPAAGTISVPVVAVNGKVWAKTPLSPKMAPIDPKQFGAPDPAQIFSTDRGFSNLLVATQAPKFGPEKRDGKDIVQTVTGSLPGSLIKSSLSFGEANQSYAAVYLITKTGQLRSAKLTGEFYKGAADTSYTVEFSRYGEKVDIQQP